MNRPVFPAHFHAYRWHGERRTFDREADRRPTSPTFAANACTPMTISHWLLRPAGAIAHTFRTPEEAADWFGREMRRAAPDFAAGHEREPERLDAKAAYIEQTLAWGGDTHAGWHLRGTAFLTLDIIGCTPNRTDPDLPCPLER
ncbi:hypothetical protein [Streptomyces sp. URMC 129]|uniref:hypothetical protein n=1 Tax=Streptomyces sp. URMC 129 TaxID=3423407 RepID=UPI003F1D3CD1